MPKWDFNKDSLQLRHGCSPVNLQHIFRTLFYKNTSGVLFLKVFSISRIFENISNI